MALTIDELLSMIPDNQKETVKTVISTFTPDLLSMAKDVAWGYVQRLQKGDLTAVQELLAQKSDDAFIQEVKANTAAWDAIATASATLKKMQNQIMVAVAPVLLTILLTVVGL